MTATIETLDQIRVALADKTLHVEGICGMDAYVVRERANSNASYRFLIPEPLVDEAVEQGILVESKVYCSCFELASNA